MLISVSVRGLNLFKISFEPLSWQSCALRLINKIKGTYLLFDLVIRDLGCLLKLEKSGIRGIIICFDRHFFGGCIIDLGLRG